MPRKRRSLKPYEKIFVDMIMCFLPRTSVPLKKPYNCVWRIGSVIISREITEKSQR
jgi:hypothetical protein